MTTYFADTAFYVAVLNPRDVLHAKTLAAVARPYRIVTTEFILIEAANFFCRAAWRSAFGDLLAAVRADPDTVVEPASAALFAAGLQVFEARPDKDWSLTDCTSFAVMAAAGLADALTADRHYAQAGFRPLLA